jgi:hypothetical protein
VEKPADSCPNCGSIKSLDWKHKTAWACGSRIIDGEYHQSNGCRDLVAVQLASRPTTPSSAAAEPLTEAFLAAADIEANTPITIGAAPLTDEQLDQFAKHHIMAPEEWDLVAQAKEANALRQQLATAARDLTWQREMRDKAIAELKAQEIAIGHERKEAADRLAEVTRERDALTEELKSAKHYGDHQRAARLEAEAELSALKAEIGDPDDVEPDVIE